MSWFFSTNLRLPNVISGKVVLIKVSQYFAVPMLFPGLYSAFTMLYHTSLIVTMLTYTLPCFHYAFAMGNFCKGVQD